MKGYAGFQKSLYSSLILFLLFPIALCIDPILKMQVFIIIPKYRHDIIERFPLLTDSFYSFNITYDTLTHVILSTRVSLTYIADKNSKMYKKYAICHRLTNFMHNFEYHV